MINLPESEEMYVRMLVKLFDSMTNSYKIFWFKGLFEEVIKGKYEVDFIEVISAMISNAWYPRLKYHLNFGTQDKLGICIDNLNKNSIKNVDINKNSLYKFILDGKKNKNIYDEIAFLYRYVPYRFIAPFFEYELSGEKDSNKNKMIEYLALNSSKVLYSIDSKNKKLYINSNWSKYIIDNQETIDEWIRDELITYLQRKNPNTPDIVNKLDLQSE